MLSRCPGRNNVKNLDSLLVRCPKCNEPVEIFTDEVKARCRCGEVILRESVPVCISWCPAAEQCLGEVIDLRLVRRRLAERHGQQAADNYVKEIGGKARSNKCPADPAGDAPPKSEPGS